MSQKAYDSPQYVAQKLRSSLVKLLGEKTGGVISVTHSSNPKDNLDILSYEVSRCNAHIEIRKKGTVFYFRQENAVLGSDNLEVTSEGKLDIKRSKAGRISEDYAEQLAQKSFQTLKDFYEQQQSSKQ